MRKNTTDLLSFWGKSAEMKVASKLLEMGIMPSVPLVDVGFDLITDKGKRIQVKSSRTRISKNQGKYSYDCYIFNTWSGKGKRRKKLSKDKFDFLILCAHDVDRFWIMPVQDIKTTNNIKINVMYTNKKTSRYEKYENAWEFLER